MILAACIDDRGGMLFHHRRQSQDRLLRQDLLEEAAGRPVWMSAYSYKLFSPAPENVHTAEDFFSRALEGEWCFFEDVDPAPWLSKAEKVVLYRWNRIYPADLYFPDLPEGWKMERREDFPGSSHEMISKEVLVRPER